MPDIDQAPSGTEEVVDWGDDAENDVFEEKIDWGEGENDDGLDQDGDGWDDCAEEATELY